MKDIFDDAVALYMNKPNALVNNIKTYITEDRSISPFWENGEALVPIKFFAESIGGSCSINSKENSITVTCEDTSITMYNPKIEKKVHYASVADLCRSMGLYLFLDSELLIYSFKQLNLSWDKDFMLLCTVCESFIYDDVTGAEIVGMVKKNHPDNVHPRMIMTENRFEIIRDELAKGEKGDPVYAQLINTLKEKCDQLLYMEPKRYDITDGVRLIHVCNDIKERVLSLALMYQITGKDEYAERARREIMAACNFKDWHPYHFLDTGIMSFAIGLAYDWLYNWLDEKERKRIREAIVEKAIAQVMNDYDKKTIKGNDQSNLLVRTTFWDRDQAGNWRFVAGGGVATAALAICDELEGNELAMAERCMEQALIGIRSSISEFAPDGSNKEGVGYWDFACRHWQEHVVSLLTSTGSDFGYFDAPGLKDTNAFIRAMNGPVLKYGYHDVKYHTGLTAIPAGSLFWAEHFKKFGEAEPRIEHILKGEGNYHDLLFYNPKFLGVQSSRKDLDFLSKSIGIFTARSSWDNEALWVGFHADNGLVPPTHDHMDGGSFVLQFMGESFFFDLGSDDYNVPNYRQNAYRVRAEGHNGILVNPGKGQYGPYDMQMGGKCSIDTYMSNQEGAFAQADITDLFREDLVSGRRGVMLSNRRKTVTVQDELIMKEPSEVYWFAHTRAEISISENGKKAYLEQNGKILTAEITCGDNAVFSVMNAKPLPTSPECRGQNENKGIRKLTIYLRDVVAVNLVVIFNAGNGNKEFIPLNKWSIEKI